MPFIASPPPLIQPHILPGYDIFAMYLRYIYDIHAIFARIFVAPTLAALETCYLGVGAGPLNNTHTLTHVRHMATCYQVAWVGGRKSLRFVFRVFL